MEHTSKLRCHHTDDGKSGMISFILLWKYYEDTQANYCERSSGASVLHLFISSSGWYLIFIDFFLIINEIPKTSEEYCYTWHRQKQRDVVKSWNRLNTFWRVPYIEHTSNSCLTQLHRRHFKFCLRHRFLPKFYDDYIENTEWWNKLLAYFVVRIPMTTMGVIVKKSKIKK